VKGTTGGRKDRLALNWLISEIPTGCIKAVQIITPQIHKVIDVLYLW
jgi:hypothetical protein